jgi:hypothetical protein
MGRGAYIDTPYDQQLGQSLQGSGQARRDEEDVPSGATRKVEGMGTKRVAGPGSTLPRTLPRGTVDGTRLNYGMRVVLALNHTGDNTSHVSVQPNGD